MISFKEIDERIKHYEEEIQWSSEMIKNITEALNVEDEKDKILEDAKMKLEFFCFVTSSYIDLLCSYRNFKRSKTEWETFFNLKISYLIIYETIKTYHKYKKEIFITVTKQEKTYYKSFFDMLNRELSDFKYDYNYDIIMSKIRNKSTAHYDKNFLDYYASFELINNKQSKNIIGSFMNFINPLHYFTYGLAQGKIDKFQFLNSWLS